MKPSVGGGDESRDSNTTPKTGDAGCCPTSSHRRTASGLLGAGCSTFAARSCRPFFWARDVRQKSVGAIKQGLRP